MENSSIVRLIKPNISQAEIDAASRVLASGMLVSGPIVQQFERLLAEYIGVAHAVCVSSGTAALHLSLLAADIRPTDEVLVPAFTFPATANVVEIVGAIPIFIDCQPGSVNIDPDRLAEHIGPRTKAIMPVHAFGIPAEMDAIREVARKYDLVVIEDAACALGSKYKGIKCGTFGDLAAFSFHPRKLLTTGEGGVIATNDLITAQTLRSLRNHGYDGDDYRRPGFNYRMTDFQAALGISQLGKLEAYLDKRKNLAKTFRSILQDIEWLEIVEGDSEVESNIQTFLIRVPDEVDRDALIIHLVANGIEATIGTYCVPLTRYYRLRYGFTKSEFPEAYRAFRQCLSLPLHDALGSKDMFRIAEALRAFKGRAVEAKA